VVKIFPSVHERENFFFHPLKREPMDGFPFTPFSLIEKYAYLEDDTYHEKDKTAGSMCV